MSEIKANKIGGLEGTATLEVQTDMSLESLKYLYFAGDGSTTYIRGSSTSVALDAEDQLLLYADTSMTMTTPVVIVLGQVRSFLAGSATNPQFHVHQTIGADDYARVTFDSSVAMTDGAMGWSHEWTLSAKPTAEGSEADARFNIFYGDQDGSGGGANILQCMGDGDVDVLGTLTAGVKPFNIPHPNPSKRETHTLWHTAIESPTAGENLYRWQLDVTGGSLTMELPDYYPFLNINDMVWISPVGHFGAAYGEVSEDQKSLTITANADGKYNVLLIGTRKDEIATNAWKGAEREGPHRRFTEDG